MTPLNDTTPMTPNARPEAPETPPGPVARRCAEILALTARTRAVYANAQATRARVVNALPAAQARHDAYAVARLRRDLQRLDADIARLAADVARMQWEVDAWIDGFPEPYRSLIRDRIVFAAASRAQRVDSEPEPEGA